MEFLKYDWVDHEVRGKKDLFLANYVIRAGFRLLGALS